MIYKYKYNIIICDCAIIIHIIKNIHIFNNININKYILNNILVIQIIKNILITYIII